MTGANQFFSFHQPQQPMAMATCQPALWVWEVFFRAQAFLSDRSRDRGRGRHRHAKRARAEVPLRLRAIFLFMRSLAAAPYGRSARPTGTSNTPACPRAESENAEAEEDQQRARKRKKLTNALAIALSGKDLPVDVDIIKTQSAGVMFSGRRFSSLHEEEGLVLGSIQAWDRNYYFTDISFLSNGRGSLQKTWVQCGRKSQQLRSSLRSCFLFRQRRTRLYYWGSIIRSTGVLNSNETKVSSLKKCVSFCMRGRGKTRNRVNTLWDKVISHRAGECWRHVLLFRTPPNAICDA